LADLRRWRGRRLGRGHRDDRRDDGAPEPEHGPAGDGQPDDHRVEPAGDAQSSIHADGPTPARAAQAPTLRAIAGPARYPVRPLAVWLAALALALAALEAPDTGGLAAEASLPQAVVDWVEGTLAVVRADGSAFQPAGPGTPLGSGDRIATVGRSAAVVRLADGSELSLGANTTVALARLSDSVSGPRGPGGSRAARLELELIEGVMLGRLGPDSEHHVVAPGGEVLARGGALFGLGRDERGNLTAACGSCPAHGVEFPTPSRWLASGLARTLTERGDLIDFPIEGTLWDALAACCETDSSKLQVPPGQQTGSRAKLRQRERDEPFQQAGPNASSPALLGGSIATPTPTGTPPLTPTPTATPTRIATTTQATIANFVYLPDPIVISVGSSIRWTNLDDVDHTVTADDLSWTSPVMFKDDAFTRTFNERGTFHYFCEPHPFMRADIVVQ